MQLSQATIKDQLNLLSKFTAKKVINLFTLRSAYLLTKLTGRIIQKGLPVSLAVEPTTSCNLRCPECPSGLRSFTRPTGMLDKTMFQKTIDELQDTLVYLTLYFQGEPYLHPDFCEMVGYASAKGIYTATSTNAHYLTAENAEKTVQSGLDRLIISIDGTTQDVYQQYRVGGKVSKVLEGTKNIIEARKKLKAKTPFIIFQFLVVKPNEHQILEVKKLASELGVDAVKFKTAQIYNYEKGSPLIPENEKYSRYRKESDGTYSLKNKIEDGCKRMWENPVVTWDGKIVPCCFDKDANHQLGNIRYSSFKEAWESNEYKAFREKVFRSRQDIDICRNCSEGSKVWG